MEWAILHLLPSRRASLHFGQYPFAVSRRVGGWVGLGGLVKYWGSLPGQRRLGIELATIESQVQLRYHQNVEFLVHRICWRRDKGDLCGNGNTKHWQTFRSAVRLPHSSRQSFIMADRKRATDSCRRCVLQANLWRFFSFPCTAGGVDLPLVTCIRRTVVCMPVFTQKWWDKDSIPGVFQSWIGWFYVHAAARVSVDITALKIDFCSVV